MKTTLRLFAAIATLVLLAACGNKGPLMHPQAPADAMATPSSVAPTTPAGTAAPMPASTAPATPVESTPLPGQPAPPANGGG